MKDRPKRIQLRRSAGWRLPAGATSVARPTMWGNPWKPGAPGRFWLPTWLTRDDELPRPLTVAECVELYRRHLASGTVSALPIPARLTAQGVEMAHRGLEAHRARIVENLHRLRGLDLACWCPAGAPCHADVLLEMANRED